MKLKLLSIWRLKFQSKVGKIKEDSWCFSVSCHVVKPPFCILSASSSLTRLVFIHQWSRRVDLDHQMKVKSRPSFSLNLHPPTKILLKTLGCSNLRITMFLALRAYKCSENRTEKRLNLELTHVDRRTVFATASSVHVCTLNINIAAKRSL